MDWSFYAQELVPALNQGLVKTILLIIPSASIGLLMGIVVGTLRAYGHPLLRKLGDGYAGLFRGTPLVVQLFVLYFGLPNLGIYLEPYTAAVVGFILCTSAYQSEYIRGGLLSIRRGQLLATQALGFSRIQSMLWIILPQAVRRALPGCSNEIVYLIKYSSLAYIITFIELTGEGKILATKYFRFTEVFLAIGLYYLIMVTVADFGLKKLEKRLYIPGFGKG
ncbi:MAG: amino acid ABC transporter permease [Deltaproteobacteria bacterium]|nr:amino acid ABC transporter permease [Deltaproteobacteria bacterium]